MGDIVTEVEKYENGWRGGLPETPCGSGSKLSNTTEQRKWIPEVIHKYDIKSIADIGAGDLNWIKHTHLPSDIEYQAYDLVPRAPEVRKFDLIHQIPPKVDLIMCLWVLNHMPYDHCKQALDNLKASGAKYLMMTHRPVWLHEQPPEIDMPYLERIYLNVKQDRNRVRIGRKPKEDQIRFIKL
jgi:hypothetical protein